MVGITYFPTTLSEITTVIKTWTKVSVRYHSFRRYWCNEVGFHLSQNWKLVLLDWEEAGKKEEERNAWKYWFFFGLKIRNSQVNVNNDNL